MRVELSHAVTADERLAEMLRKRDELLEPLLPNSAHAVWDIEADDRGGHTGLILALTDPWGHATGKFAFDELDDESRLRGRFYRLVGDLINPPPRCRIEIRDAFAPLSQFADLQDRINAIPGIATKNLQLLNRIRNDPSAATRVLITDFAIEVDASVAEQVREVIRLAGFNLRGDPLIERPGMKDRVRKLVEAHAKDGQPVPRYAICFNLQDADDLHLLEIADDVSDPSEAGDGELEGVGFIAGDTLPGARSVVLYLASPSQLRRAATPPFANHPAVRSLRSRDCWFVVPDDNGNQFYREFPEFVGTGT